MLYLGEGIGHRMHDTLTIMGGKVQIAFYPKARMEGEIRDMTLS